MKKKLILLIAFAVVATTVYAAIPAIRNGWDSNGGRVFKTEAGTSIFTIGTTGITSHLLTGLAGAVTLDDGTGASPSLVLTDATDESATFSKADAGFLGLTTVAGDGLNVLVGNLKVGNGTPGQTINGEDAYVEGLAEVDGVAYLDGGAATGSGTTVLKRALGTLSFAGDESNTATVTASSGSGYHVSTAFQTNSGDAYVKTAAISSTTLTVTASAATTGTLSYEVTYW